MKQPANIKKGKKTTSFGEAKCRTEYKLFIVCGDGEKKTPSTSILVSFSVDVTLTEAHLQTAVSAV